MLLRTKALTNVRVLRSDVAALARTRGQRVPSAVALGIFDGVHLGHAGLLGCCVQLARAAGVRAVAVTFDPHPTTVLRPEAAPATVEPLEARLGHFARLGLDEAVVLQFDAALAGMEAEDFVHAVLGDALQACDVVVGYDFAFGRAQRGSAALLRQMGATGAGEAKDARFAVHQLEAVHVGDVVASSTAVRACVARGDVQGAQALLGRPFTMYGEVERGLQRGRTLGFPTANVRPHAALAPGQGIYAAWAEGSFGRRPAAVSVGVNPTFAPLATPTVEAYLLDYAGPEFYGAKVALHFVARLRGEAKFADAGALVVQMHRDCSDARRVLGRDLSAG